MNYSLIYCMLKSTFRLCPTILDICMSEINQEYTILPAWKK